MSSCASLNESRILVYVALISGLRRLASISAKQSEGCCMLAGTGRRGGAPRGGGAAGPPPPAPGGLRQAGSQQGGGGGALLLGEAATQPCVDGWL
jgi:hypothetical protein